MRFIKTSVAVIELETTYHKLIGLIRFRKIDPLPARDSSGDYLWTDADLDRARAALTAMRQRREVPA
jgi:hypothetical protein